MGGNVSDSDASSKSVEFSKESATSSEKILSTFPRSRTTPKAVATQIRIIDSVLSLMESRNIDRINVTAVAKSADITRSTFYVYFNDIYDVLDYVETNLLEHLPAPAGPRRSLALSEPYEPPTAEQCNSPSWYEEWLDYVSYFHRQFHALLGPYGNPQFPHKLRKAIRKAHRLQMRNDSFFDGPREDMLLNALSEFHLRLAKDLAGEQSPEGRDFVKSTGISFLNTIRIGGWYLRFINNSLDDK